MSELDSQTRFYLNLATDSRTLPDLPNKKNKTNWVEKAGGLPSYIKRIAKHLHSEKGMDVSRAIAVAVNTVKRWCSSGTVTEGGKGEGGHGVTAKTKALACKAVAAWEAKKASSGLHASLDANGKERMVNFEGQLMFESDRDLILSIAAEIEVMDDDEFDFDAFNLALESERLERGLNDDGYAEEDEELDLSGESVHGESLVDERPLSLSQEVDDDAFLDALDTERERLHLSLPDISFNPSKHPRDLTGKFKAAVSQLHIGQSVKLPDGTTVERQKKLGFGEYTVKRDGDELLTTRNANEASIKALDHSAGLTHESSVGGGKSYSSHGTAMAAADDNKKKSERESRLTGYASRRVGVTRDRRNVK